MRWGLICLLCLIGSLGVSAHAADNGWAMLPLIIEAERQPDEVIPLWPSDAPGGDKVTVQPQTLDRTNPYGLPDHALTNITHPTMAVFKSETPTGSAMLLIPGGGYQRVVVEKEGYESARVFNRYGMTVFVMNYRLPHQGWAAGADTPLQDAQRAIRLIRARAAQDGINPDQVMVMGFSAGGHVAGSLATRFGADVYEPVDDADQFSARPDGVVLIYPVASMDLSVTHKGSRDRLIGSAPDPAIIEKYSIDRKPPSDAPPTLLIHSSDDQSVPVENALRVFHGFKAAGIPVSLHVFEHGVHGFGVRLEEGDPLTAWPQLVYEWAMDKGLVTAEEATP